MLRAFVLTLYFVPLMILWAFAPLASISLRSLSTGAGWRQAAVVGRSCVLGLVVVPLIWGLQVWHWLGFLLDELFARGYRRVVPLSPIFITGVPRSGTTHLHRVLAQHERLTSMTLWECVAAPSVVQRWLVRGLGRLVAWPWCKHWGGRLRTGKLFKALAPVHHLGWREAEEDFVALISVNACFLLVLLFPSSRWYWRLVDFDCAISSWKKRVILDFYYALVQKHLYAQGVRASRSSVLRYLSKNPSFTPWVGSLRQRFPTARFVLCERDPSRVVASQISALVPAWTLVHGRPMERWFVDRLLMMLARFYTLIDVYCALDADVMRLSMERLVSDLVGAVTCVMRHVEEPMTATFDERLAQARTCALTYRSAHRYSLSQFSVHWGTIQQRFPQRYWQATMQEGATR